MPKIAQDSKIKRQLCQMNEIPYGELFLRITQKGSDKGTLMMRNKPTGMLLNSNVVVDNLNKGNVLCTVYQTGVTMILKGDELVAEVEYEPLSYILKGE